MIDLTKVQNFYIACGYTDLRLGIDGLAAVVKQQYGSHFDEERLFLFCGRRTDRIKALYWCGDGYKITAESRWRDSAVILFGPGDYCALTYYALTFK